MWHDLHVIEKQTRRETIERNRGHNFSLVNSLSSIFNLFKLSKGNQCKPKQKLNKLSISSFSGRCSFFRKVTTPKGVSKSRPIEYRYEMTKRSEETEKAREGEKEFAHSAETGDPRMQKQINL